MRNRDSEPFLSIVFVGFRRPPVWAWETWKEVVPPLSRLLEVSGFEGAIRSTQDDGRGTRQVSFGRMDWRSDGDLPCIFGAPSSRGTSRTRRHAVTEVWAPRWTVVAHGDTAPGVFVQVENPHFLTASADTQFNQLIHIAVPVQLARRSEGRVLESLEELGALADARMRVYRVAPWLRNGDCVHDGLQNHFHHVGSWDSPVPDLGKLKTAWRPFSGDLSVA